MAQALSFCYWASDHTQALSFSAAGSKQPSLCGLTWLLFRVTITPSGYVFQNVLVTPGACLGSPDFLFFFPVSEPKPQAEQYLQPAAMLRTGRLVWECSAVGATCNKGQCCCRAAAGFDDTWSRAPTCHVTAPPVLLPCPQHPESLHFGAKWAGGWADLRSGFFLYWSACPSNGIHSMCNPTSYGHSASVQLVHIQVTPWMCLMASWFQTLLRWSWASNFARLI